MVCVSWLGNGEAVNEGGTPRLGGPNDHAIIMMHLDHVSRHHTRWTVTDARNRNRETSLLQRPQSTTVQDARRAADLKMRKLRWHSLSLACPTPLPDADVFSMPSWDTSLCHQVGVARQLDAHLAKGSFVYLRCP